MYIDKPTKYLYCVGSHQFILQLTVVELQLLRKTQEGAH